MTTWQVNDTIQDRRGKLYLIKSIDHNIITAQGGDKDNWTQCYTQVEFEQAGFQKVIKIPAANLCISEPEYFDSYFDSD